MRFAFVAITGLLIALSSQAQIPQRERPIDRRVFLSEEYDKLVVINRGMFETWRGYQTCRRPRSAFHYAERDWTLDTKKILETRQREAREASSDADADSKLICGAEEFLAYDKSEARELPQWILRFMRLIHNHMDEHSISAKRKVAEIGLTLALEYHVYANYALKETMYARLGAEFATRLLSIDRTGWSP